MPIPATPPSGAAQLNQNARTVIEKRYLIKDATGKPTEQPEDMFWRVASGCRSRSALRRGRHGSDGADAEILFVDDRASVRAQLADADECRPSAGPALGVLRSSGRGLAVQRTERDLRHAALDGAHPSVGWRHGLQLLASARHGARWCARRPASRRGRCRS